ncbi:hypothetical protein RD792_013273, partial [Penstemon davidsonii]
WDLSEINHLPEYMKPLYEALLDLYQQFDNELAKEGRYYAVYYAIEALKELVRSYHVEAKWFIEGYKPPFADYLDNALITCTYCYHTTTSLLGTKSATKDEFQWLSNKPKMLLAGLKICRLIDDIATYEVEKERGQITTGHTSFHESLELDFCYCYNDGHSDWSPVIFVVNDLHALISSTAPETPLILDLLGMVLTSVFLFFFLPIHWLASYSCS